MDSLLVGVSGSVAVLNLPSYLATLRAELAREVRVIMTAAAASMLPPSTVALVCDAVFLDQESSVEKRPGHIERSEERRVGKECRSRWSRYHEREYRIIVSE